MQSDIIQLIKKLPKENLLIIFFLRTIIVMHIVYTVHKHFFVRPLIDEFNKTSEIVRLSNINIKTKKRCCKNTRKCNALTLL